MVLKDVTITFAGLKSFETANDALAEIRANGGLAYVLHEIDSVQWIERVPAASHFDSDLYLVMPYGFFLDAVETGVVVTDTVIP